MPVILRQSSRGCGRPGIFAVPWNFFGEFWQYSCYTSLLSALSTHPDPPFKQVSDAYWP